MQHGGRNCCRFFPDVMFQIHHCPWFLFVHLALEISSEEEVLRLGTLVPMNIELPTKHPLSQDRIVFENRLHSKSPMPYKPALHGNWNALRIARRALKDKFPTPTVPLTAVLQNRQAFLPDPILCDMSSYSKFIKKTLKPVDKVMNAFKLSQNVKTQNRPCSTVHCTHTCLCRV